MDLSPLALVKLLVPRIPLILSTMILNKLSLSANSDKQDTRTEIVVNIIRDVMRINKPLKVLQDGSIKDPGIKGKMWISKTAAPAPDTCVRDAVIQGIKILGDGREDFILPDIVDVEGEWTGYRNTSDNKAPRLDESEEDQYRHLMKEVTSETVILYFHGGAFIVMDPAALRTLTSGLARSTGGRAFSVRYRLAPQNPFPAALLDALTTYLYLLAPPPGSYHKPVLAKNIVFSGESAGGNLSSALCLLLLTLKRAGVQSIPFHGKDVPIELPGGMALNSPWTDIGRTLPSTRNNAKYDYLDPPTATGLPFIELPPDETWPAKPPRAEYYCQASLMMHPLVSPVIASPDQWKGIPPTFICVGHEGLEDEITVTARHMYLAGGSVEFAHYSGMPHCFAMIFPGTPASQDCIDRWSRFCADVTTGRVERIETGTSTVPFSSPLKFIEVPLATMGVSDDVVKTSMQRVKNMATEREQDQIKRWKQDSRAKL